MSGTAKVIVNDDPAGKREKREKLDETNEPRGTNARGRIAFAAIARRRRRTIWVSRGLKYS
jgi:hypothetical protein